MNTMNPSDEWGALQFVNHSSVEFLRISRLADGSLVVTIPIEVRKAAEEFWRIVAELAPPHNAVLEVEKKETP